MRSQWNQLGEKHNTCIYHCISYSISDNFGEKLGSACFYARVDILSTCPHGWKCMFTGTIHQNLFAFECKLELFQHLRNDWHKTKWTKDPLAHIFHIQNHLGQFGKAKAGKPGLKLWWTHQTYSNITIYSTFPWYQLYPNIIPIQWYIMRSLYHDWHWLTIKFTGFSQNFQTNLSAPVSESFHPKRGRDFSSAWGCSNAAWDPDGTFKYDHFIGLDPSPFEKLWR